MSKFHMKDGYSISRLDDGTIVLLFESAPGNDAVLLKMTPTEFASAVASVCPDGYERSFHALRRILEA